MSQARRASGSREWAELLEQHGIDVRSAPCEPRGEGLFFPSLGTTIPGPADSVLLSGFQRACRLHKRGVALDAQRSPVRATVGSTSVNVETAEELQILEEIYLDGSYCFDLEGPVLVVDIGMNTGYTALYFAATHPDALIYAYEPFAPTYRRAEANLALNPTLRQKIHAFQFGLSDATRTMDIEYVDRYRGSVGVYGVPTKLRVQSEVTVERCQFRDVATELGQLIEQHPNRRIVLKVDCEGSEYAILGRLAESAVLDRVDLLLMECHRRAREHDPGALRASLVRHGFGCVHLNPDSPDISMIYAAKLSVTGSNAKAAPA